MMFDEVLPGSKHCTFVYGQVTFRPIVRAAAENPDRHVSGSGNWEAGSTIASAQSRSATVYVPRVTLFRPLIIMLQDLVNGTEEAGTGKDTPLADSGCCCEAVQSLRPDPNTSTSV